mmetsp:Transcript_13130/g.24672  ORF Transcript_13130/g.24672 Transcript_13130/m.24672 type:complete len:282 (+) Transcript_13130:2684-3529(+)|eukprot:CAMPEP_0176491758 /NCGR_PEP_ID=MMETSP0200_2-20121128/8606_1 /TAXON_ID=947934 /ORGANISM="Chaetoceros sp., Strain GSL56" /LENGTH=281 /DNA_ID=CAMNT_0017889215 /DNA_START=196 /DNA_END=1041 /DNA_ORIENTATION=-
MRILKLAGLSTASAFFTTVANNAPKKVAVFGGTGYVGSAVCERLVQKGHDVTAISRRGANPRPGDSNLDQVKWVKGDATDPSTVKGIVKDADAVVHAIGLLFDVDSGLEKFNTIVSGSKSLPGENSTYDNITRKTMFNICDAIEEKYAFPKIGGQEKFPLCFVSAAEAGWPEVSGGSFVEEKLAPEWLKRYLGAKRVVEDRLRKSDKIRGVIYRPSLIWDWTKYDVLPAIPIFNLASAVGVPFVDKTIRVETLAAAIVAGIEDDSVQGVQRYMQMETLARN